MLTVKDVTLDNGRYGEGFGCSVTFQVGPYSYSTIKIDLPPHATRGVVELAIAEAKALLAADGGEIAIKGEKPVPAADEDLAPPAFLTLDATRADPADGISPVPVDADEVVF